MMLAVLTTMSGSRRILLALAAAVCAASLCSNRAWAYAPGVASGNPFGGGKAAVNGAGGGSCARTNEKKDFKKPDLPPAASVANLDEAKLKKAIEQLSFGAEVKQKAEEVLKRVRADWDALLKAQTDARAAYQKARTQEQVMEAGREVVATADACRKANPVRSFEQGIRNLLSAEHAEKLRELLR